MQDLHQIQMLILRELLFKPNSRFSELNIKGLSNDHFSYHVNTLLDLGLVKKSENGYSLTSNGKEFANRMDTDQAEMEKQPKVAVMVIAYKYIKGTKYLLMQERSKEPFYGYKGFITGKMRFGEKIQESAKRELKEETGLDCNDITLKTIYHDHVITSENGKLMEDKIFFVTVAKNPTGKLMDTESGKHSWVSEKEYWETEKKYYNEDNIYESSKKRRGALDICENTYAVQEF